MIPSRGRRNDEAKRLRDYFHALSVKPYFNPWALAPLGATLLLCGYFALVWPEVLHQLEGGLMKYAVAAVIALAQRTGVGEYC